MERLAPDDPRSIGGYRLLGRLGAGGMGQVYLARSERGRTVAVKTIQPGLAREPHFRRRFAQEIATARRVGGEWTAPVLDADTEAATPWVATGYIAGPTLHRVVAHDHGPLPGRSLRILADGLVKALRDIHSTGLIHRDLKPSNIMITIEGPRVIDFGIARALDGITSGGLTSTGAVIGSPGFMSPEQVRGLRLGPASDVFSLGSVLAYAATGRLPFGTGDSGGHALMFRIVQEEPDLEGVPEPLRGLIADCLHKEPEQRPTVAELLERTGVNEPGGDEPRGPWLPAEVLAQLGRHAVALLDSEDPDAGERRDGALAAKTTSTAQPTSTARPAAAVHPPTQAAHAAHPPAHAAPPHAHPSAAPAYGWDFPASSAPPATPVAPAVPPPVRVRGLTTALTWMFAGLTVLLTALVLHHAAALGEIPGWDDDGIGLLGRHLADPDAAIHGAESVLGLAVSVVWLVWFRRVRRNAEAIAPGRIRYSGAASVWLWFVPLVNLALPKQIADDIYRVSHPAPRPSLALVNAWWTLLLGYFALSVVSEGNANVVGTRREPGGEAIELAENAVGALAALLALVLIRRISTHQSRWLTGVAR
ncbi:protein kinase domain-containing protein [Streptomyces radicis]|uniref:DUF4328 domain-containing protein n=1 Tax=Streptomyces radicis TaxID=1750517 RepID=A0A3A9WZ75_9ACTN|nr:DUF4328 domain-containing protein [Streptomyces radicis]RKN11507.1 DUF4328 domain-containing protein [Streptomyces radicis]RKN26474.1 DUF4328 domain-containing protein [Streptomyces radicis]